MTVADCVEPRGDHECDARRPVPQAHPHDMPQQLAPLADSTTAIMAETDSVAPQKRTSFAGEAMWGIMDQGVMSGARFATTWLVGFYGGSSVLGIYAMVWSLLLLQICVQEALVTTPYSVFNGHYSTLDGRKYLTGACLISLGLCCVGAIGIIGWTLIHGAKADLLSAISILLLFSPGLLLRELVRRVEIAHGRSWNALFVDSSVAIAQLLLVAYLGATGQLTGPRTWMIVGGVSTVVGIVWCVMSRQRYFAWDWQFIWREWQAVRGFGGWVFASQMSGALLVASVPWVLGVFHGERSAGVFAACNTVVLFANPFLLGVGNILTPHSAQVYLRDGMRGLCRLATRANLLVLLVMSLFTVVVAFAGETVVRILFPGAEYAVPNITFVLLGLFAISFGLAICCGMYLQAIHRPELSAIASLIGTLAGIATMLFLVGDYQIAGAAAGLLVGHLVWACLGQFFFFSIARRQVRVL